MPRSDQEKMAKLVSELRRNVGRLRTLAESSRDEFVKDSDKVGSAKYHFIVAIEACIDICNHIISRNSLRIPENYADTFLVMREAGVFTEEFSETLATMAKFRNRLVHLYWEVDDHQLYGILKTRLGDFKLFLDAIALYLGWPEEKK